MTTIKTISEMRTAIAGHVDSRVGLVPTMGALHDGHVALFRAARGECDTVVASLFVNASQFDNAADLAMYPRDAARDAAIAQEAGVDYVFAPTAQEMYGSGHATWMDVRGAAKGLEGASRPSHFRGVATVCLKLFLIVRPGVAYFGQKDAQQVAVVAQMVRDLNVGLDIRVVPTVRDPRRTGAVLEKLPVVTRRTPSGRRDPTGARGRRSGATERWRSRSSGRGGARRGRHRLRGRGRVQWARDARHRCTHRQHASHRQRATG